MFKPHHFLLIFSTVFFYLCFFGYFYLFYLYGGNAISWRASVHLLKTPHSVMSCWWEWNQPWWECLHHRKWQTHQLGPLSPLPPKRWPLNICQHSTGYNLGEAAPTSGAGTGVSRQEWLSRGGGRGGPLAASTHSSREMEHDLDKLIWTGANS